MHVVLSGFGLTGPYATWRNSPLVDWTSGGYAYITGEPDREPLQGGGPWAAYQHGCWAAIGAAAAAIHAARTGEGQLVDIGAMEAVAASHQWTLTMYTHTGGVKGRWGRRFGESFHLTAQPEFSSIGTQLWFLPYSGGPAQRITNDLNGYGEVSLGLTSDSGTIATIQQVNASSIWISLPVKMRVGHDRFLKPISLRRSHGRLMEKSSMQVAPEKIGTSGWLIQMAPKANN